MDELLEGFEDRLQEIEAYLDLLENIEKQVQRGIPRIGTDGPIISVLQQKILLSSVFLQLYNLVESTVSRCLNAVGTAASEGGRWQPGDLAVKLRKDWVRVTARTHTELNAENRLDGAFALCEHLLQMLPVTDWGVSKGAGGNWDDNRIEALGVRLGIDLSISEPVKLQVKKHFRNDKGTLEFVKEFRNWLAHGNVSFAEGGENLTVGDLRKLKDGTALYLREVVSCFRAYIDRYEFLLPEKRPV